MPNPPPLQQDVCYHIYNRGNNGEDLFPEQRNYAYFLKLYAHHVSPLVDTFAYCLLRNHFHLLVRIKPDAVDGAASAAFANLFKAYAVAINKAMGRTGSLFESPFNRRVVSTEAYFMRLVVYIHLNPIKHGFVTNLDDWPYSSYHAMKSDGITKLRREEVIGWFGSRQHFVDSHTKFAPDAWLMEQDFEV